jgi:hypothetical protein
MSNLLLPVAARCQVRTAMKAVCLMNLSLRKTKNRHQVTLLTAQGFVREEIYKWDYTVGELVNGIEDGSFVVWDSRSI